MSIENGFNVEFSNNITVTLTETDDALSATSENAVQNKVICAALDKKANVSHTHTYDSTVTATSENAVQGKAVYAELAKKADKGEAGGASVTVDSALSSESTNPVQNKTVTNALSGKADKTHTHTATDLGGLSAVAVSGSYNDLTDKPDLTEGSASSGIKIEKGSYIGQGMTQWVPCSITDPYLVCITWENEGTESVCFTGVSNYMQSTGNEVFYWDAEGFCVSSSYSGAPELADEGKIYHWVVIGK